MASGADPALYTLSGHAKGSYSPFTTNQKRNELNTVESHMVVVVVVVVVMEGVMMVVVEVVVVAVVVVAVMMVD